MIPRWIGMPTGARAVAVSTGNAPRTRDRHERAIVELGFQALAHLSFPALIDVAARSIAETLDVTMVWIAELQSDGDLVVRAGIGLGNDVERAMRLSGGPQSLSGYTVQTGGPIISEDLLCERRFTPAPSLLERGARSAVSVVVGTPESRYGVLGAGTSSPRRFSFDDVVFVETVANVIAAALQRMEAEQAARVRAEQYDSILQATSDGFCLLERGGQILDANEAYCRMTGYHRDELLGMAITELDASLSDTEIADVINRVRSDGFVRFETHHRAKDGRLVDVEVSMSCCVEQDRLVHFTRDITRRKRAEAELAEMRDLLDRSQQLSRTGGWHYDIATGQGVWTEQVYDIYGVDKESFDPVDLSTAISYYDEASRPVIEAAFRRAISDGLPYDLELGLIRADGRRIIVRTIGEPMFEDGRVARVAGNIADITELRQAEEQLRHERDFIDATLDVAGALIMVMDSEWRLVRFNRQSELLSGYREAEVIGREYDFLVPADERETVRSNLEPAHPDRPVSQVNRWITKAGELRTIRWSNAALVDAERRRTHVIGIGIDITDQQRAEQARERLAAI
ncbi:MAG TPA: PAS domain S-box protein, partial [Solirubrobacteraceae bacterium]|nr:PAS domain S-box protein [Solirubrobacteraceae bacterium]